MIIMKAFTFIRKCSAKIWNNAFQKEPIPTG
jgi:hypothetical protein